MSLDKKVWQEALKHYAEWNEAKLIQEIHDAGKKTPQQKWEEFIDLYTFGLRLRPERSKWEQKKIQEEWSAYYESIRWFEEWRKKRGRKD